MRNNFSEIELWVPCRILSVWANISPPPGRRVPVRDGFRSPSWCPEQTRSEGMLSVEAKREREIWKYNSVKGRTFTINIWMRCYKNTERWKSSRYIPHVFQTVSPYINVTPAAVYVCKVQQAQRLQRTVTVLQSDLHRFLQRFRTESLEDWIDAKVLLKFDDGEMWKILLDYTEDGLYIKVKLNVSRTCKRSHIIKTHFDSAPCF